MNPARSEEFGGPVADLKLFTWRDMIMARSVFVTDVSLIGLGDRLLLFLWANWFNQWTLDPAPDASRHKRVSLFRKL